MPPRPRKPSTKLSNGLLEAIDFLSVAQNDVGTQPYDKHILLSNKCAISYNEQLTSGILINEEIYCAPNTTTLKAALSKCIEGYTLSIDGQKIVLKSGKFKASIPCIDPVLLSPRNPDPPCAQINDTLRPAFECMNIIKPEPDAQKVHLLAFLMNGQSVISTDGRILIEYWHGLNLPTNIAIPKALITAILKNPKKLYSFGFSQTSVTFYFEDNSFVKSQLYGDEWPTENMNAILGKPCNAQPINPDFYKGLDAVSTFSENGSVYFERDLLCSHSDKGTGASYEVAGLHAGPIYSIKYLAAARSYIEQVDFYVPTNGLIHGTGGKGSMCFFFGKNVRGVIAGHG